MSEAAGEVLQLAHKKLYIELQGVDLDAVASNAICAGIIDREVEEEQVCCTVKQLNEFRMRRGVWFNEDDSVVIIVRKRKWKRKNGKDC